MLSVVLVEPKTPGNIGSVARVMKNFGVRHLLLVNPKCNYLDGEAYGRAMHARDILKAATIEKNLSSCLKKFDYAVATTSDLGSDYNVVKSPITPGQLAQQLQRFGNGKGKGSRVALVFGREGTGLTAKEVGSCDLVVTIQSSKKYPSLNLSHAVAIVLYEIFQNSRAVKVGSHIHPASASDKRVAVSMVDAILDRMDFAIHSKKETQEVVLSRLINKSFLTKREMYAFLGFLRKIAEMIKK
ncbi:RNA methyltransferase [Candidatus Woesearchaeota archaeon]|nr:RNA methyltransferase [Candidatus Woesearchaeota archaeon]